MGRRHKELIKAAIRADLLAQFARQRAREGESLSWQWLYGEFLPSLSRKELIALEECLAEMITQGLIVPVQAVRPSYALTARGAALL
ncbi:hypothetical protein [Desulfogranum mediterraneum]|uniref:hypothetical protein n=1 Tax=Desulfogranum mediterraneum TaxID=160661 RepID=UPI0004016443|nr:hypothetical protein [Desulfogranum mediterraneum]